MAEETSEKWRWHTFLEKKHTHEVLKRSVHHMKDDTADVERSVGALNAVVNSSDYDRRYRKMYLRTPTNDFR